MGFVTKYFKPNLPGKFSVLTWHKEAGKPSRGSAAQGGQGTFSPVYLGSYVMNTIVMGMVFPIATCRISTAGPDI